ncbi:MAG: LysR family transcriptional regulator [Aestuariivirga sp.]
MTDINNSKLRRLDMTMLLVFSEALKHRKLTEAAARLGLTQPAVSHTMARLRDLFGDPLFLRKPHGVEPTARALALAPHVQTMIETAQAGLLGSPKFSPAGSSVVFRIAALDYETAVFGPPLCRMLAREAPQAVAVFRSLPPARALDALDNGEVDVVVGFLPGLPEAYGRRDFYLETYAVVHRKGLRQVGGLRAYLAREHALVSFSGERRGIVDAALAEKGHQRRIRAVFPLFLPALAAVAETDLIATLPRRLAATQACRFGLGINEPPVGLRAFPVRAIWHPRSHNDPKIAWLADKLAACAPT